MGVKTALSQLNHVHSFIPSDNHDSWPATFHSLSGVQTVQGISKHSHPSLFPTKTFYNILLNSTGKHGAYFKDKSCSLCRTILHKSTGKHGVSSIWYILKTKPCCLHHTNFEHVYIYIFREYDHICSYISQR